MPGKIPRPVGTKSNKKHSALKRLESSCWNCLYILKVFYQNFISLSKKRRKEACAVSYIFAFHQLTTCMRKLGDHKFWEMGRERESKSRERREEGEILDSIYVVIIYAKYMYYIYAIIKT